MPLIPTTLSSGLLKLTDPDDPGFLGFPANAEEAGNNWATVFESYLITQTIPPPPTAQLAATAGRSLAVQAFVAASNSGANPLDAILLAYVTQIVLLTPPALGVSAPPPGTPPVALALLPFIAVPIADPRPPALAIAATVQAWLMTGTFTPVTPPGAPPQLWA